MKPAYFLITLLLLSGCQSASLEYRHSSAELPPVGSSLQLHKELVIPVGKANVIIQDGGVQPSSWQLNRYRPFCDFELNSVGKTARKVPPQTFTVIRALRNYENVMRDSPLHVAARDTVNDALIARHDSANGAPLENNMLIMYLRADTDLDVLRMTCQVWIDAAIDEPITIADVRGTLGELFTLKFPEAKTP